MPQSLTPERRRLLRRAVAMRRATDLTWPEIHQRVDGGTHYASADSMRVACRRQIADVPISPREKRKLRPESPYQRLCRLEREMGYHAAADAVCTYYAGNEMQS